MASNPYFASLFLIYLTSLIGLSEQIDPNKVILAINAGGPSMIDDNGIEYEKDPLEEHGIASDFGKMFDIRDTSGRNQILYQTERYTMGDSFRYNIPVTGDGEYVLVLKFCEVYFHSEEQKVFDVQFNEVHEVVENLDIFAEVGHATAFDIGIPFSVENGGTELLLETGQNSPIYGRRIPLDFLKGDFDNPKINAFYVYKGTLTDMMPVSHPKIIHYLRILLRKYTNDEAMESEQDYESEEDIVPFNMAEDIGDFTVPYKRNDNKNARKSGPPSQDPWEDTPMIFKFWPVVAVLVMSYVGGLLAVKFVVGHDENDKVGKIKTK